MNPAVCMPYRTLVLLACVALSSPVPAGAQTYAIHSDLLFYGDNTEFTNPFRSGETIFGTSGRVLLDVTFNETVTLRGGLFGSGRFGAHEFLEHAEPAIALQLTRGPSRLVFGSLETAAFRHDINGPDLDTPHRLLPPIQQETLVFTRGQEMGLQWLVSAPRIDHDVWINWQRLNTAGSRERFDAGYRGTFSLPASLRLHGQWHVVHEGGQQFGRGAVGDSQAGGVGLEWRGAIAHLRVILETHAIGTQHVPDRDHPRLTEAGVGTFTRGAVEHGGWREHLIVWRGWDTLKAEGDSNYLALRSDGTMFRNVRDYAEFGLTRQFHPAPGVQVFGAFRLHRIESHYEYSYRMSARVRLRKQL